VFSSFSLGNSTTYNLAQGLGSVPKALELWVRE
jgi:hypothetical protein